jgi:predicted anti-sigma-YlaC factor YlaD
MKSYLITYHYGQQTHRAYATSVAEAKAHAAEIIQYNRILPEDSMSIVQLPEGRIIYNRPSHLTLASLNEQTSSLNRFIVRAKSLLM